MASLNKVLLMGNLTRDGELRYLPSGSAVLELRMACSRKFRTRDGQDKEETLYVDVSIFGKRAEALEKWLKKGKPLFVEGRLKLDEWQDKQSGQSRSKIRVIAENVEFIGGGNGGGEGYGGGGRSHNQERGQQGRGGGGYGGGGYGGGDSGGGYGRPQTAPQPAAASTGGGNFEPISDEDVPF
jgi:single-strand DNA-binding protein